MLKRQILVPFGSIILSSYQTHPLRGLCTFARVHTYISPHARRLVCSDSSCHSVTWHFTIHIWDILYQVLHNISCIKSTKLWVLNVHTQGAILLIHVSIMHNSIRCVRLVCVFYHIIIIKNCVYLTVNVLRIHKINTLSCNDRTHHPENLHSHPMQTKIWDC